MNPLTVEEIRKLVEQAANGVVDLYEADHRADVAVVLIQTHKALVSARSDLQRVERAYAIQPPRRRAKA